MNETKQNLPDNIPDLCKRIVLTTSNEDVDLEIFDSIAEKIAYCLHRQGNSDLNSVTQFRRFYDELVMWHEKVLISPDPEIQNQAFGQCRLYIQMLCAKVAYAQGRGKVSEDFTLLVKEVIRQIRCVTQLKQAKLFFEALIGFKRAFGK